MRLQKGLVATRREGANRGLLSGAPGFRGANPPCFCTDMSYPGVQISTTRPDRTMVPAQGVPQSILGTNYNTNPLYSSTATVVQNPLLQTTSPVPQAAMSGFTSSLYTPQVAKPVGLKSGFTLSSADATASQKRAPFASNLITPVCVISRANECPLC